MGGFTIVAPLGRIIDSLLAIVLGMRGRRGVLWVHDGYRQMYRCTVWREACVL